ncbi:MAG: hypothetical protein GDA44_12635 [Prochloron sp. SP5CPC1]|nr:hypothetical protein [Candidatus Paraprochloron terpiosi SP5CPC1]
MKKKLSHVSLRLGLVASLLLTGTSAGLAQTNNGSDATNIGQTDSSTSAPQGGVPGAISAVVEALSGPTGAAPSAALAAEVAAPSAALAAEVIEAIQTQVQSGEGSGGGATTVQVTQDIQAQVSTAISDAGGVTVTVTTTTGGTQTVETVSFSRGIANAITNISPTAVSAILSSLGISRSLPLESGQLVASTTEVQLAQRGTTSSDLEDVMNLFNTFNTAFMKAGVERERAASNSENLILALASMKTWFRSNGRIKLGAVNKTTRLMKPVLESVPELRQVLQNNPNAPDYSLVLNTTTAIETVWFPLQAINDLI